jgi:hypothetical protein
MYAFVDVEQYQVVGTGSTVKAAMSSYSTALGLDGQESSKLIGSETINGVIDAITSAVVDGNTCYYFTLEGSSQVYTAFIDVSEQLPFLKSGDSISITYADLEDSNVREVTQLN